jgi:hypothetical protein
MPQILDYFLDPLYGLVCLSGQDAQLPWQLGQGSQRVLADASGIAVAVADDELGGQVEVEVYVGSDEIPHVSAFQQVFDGPLHLSGPGLLVSAPTGDEVLLREVEEGLHHLEIYSDGYPSSRLIILVDRPGVGGQIGRVREPPAVG